MATAVRRHSIVNPARRHRPGARKNKPRRHMTDKQIRHFGTKRQRAALKTRRRKNAGGKIITGYGSTVMNRAKRKRNAPHGSGGRVIAGYGSTTMNSGRRRKNASGQNSKHVVIVNRKKNRAAAHRRRTKRSNPGEILSLTLGNPAKRSRNVAATKQNKRRRHATASNPRRRHSRRQNPVMRNRRRRHNVRHHVRRNPGGLNMPSLVTDGLFVVGGLVGSRLLTQMVLGTSNTGVMGYVGNAAAGAALATVAHMMTKNPRVTGAIVTGTAAGIVARLLQDYTPLGTYLTQAGFGDYAGGGAHGVGLYLPSNAVVPQRYVDAVNSAQVQIPAGWAPTTVVQSSGAAVGVAGLYDGGGSSLY